jgi:hypothetical protein
MSAAIEQGLPGLSGSPAFPEFPALMVRAAGMRAHAALVRCGGRLRPLPAFPDSPYRLAGDEIVWLGGDNATWHPRRILLAKPIPARLSGELHLSFEGADVWRPATLSGVSAVSNGVSNAVSDGARVPGVPGFTPAQGAAACVFISANTNVIGTPAGFGVLLAARPLRFPLDLALARLRALAASVAEDNAAAFESAALPLLGLGLGLTPSGDDFVGACLFARRLRGDFASSPAWQDAATNLTRAAAARSNSISAALFGDLARGAAYAPLHELAAALRGSDAALLAAARALTAIGHSSGWDMLTGFMLGAGATIDWKPAPEAAFQPEHDSTTVFSSCSPQPART